MDNQVHEYVKLPKVRRNSNKHRNFEDENTKRYLIDDQGRRSTSDVGEIRLLRESLYDIQVQGKLGEFIKVLKVLESYSEVQSINVIQGSLKEFSDTKRFVYLSDGVTERKYVIAEINLFPNKVVSVIEVKREVRALSTLICFLNNQQSISFYYQQILCGLIDSYGTWDIEQLQFYNIDFLTLRHGKNDVQHRAGLILSKLC